MKDYKFWFTAIKDNKEVTEYGSISAVDIECAVETIKETYKEYNFVEDEIEINFY